MEFDSRIVKTDTCWLWTGARHRDGYGRVWVHRREFYMAHRFAYELWVQKIPDGLQVLHRCDVRNCVRPEHLFLGTNADNVADRVAKGRSSRGEHRPQAKLTESDVNEMRRLHSMGASTRKLARQFHLATSNVWRIVNGQSWAYRERNSA
jgi:hypothetical protein